MDLAENSAFVATFVIPCHHTPGHRCVLQPTSAFTHSRLSTGRSKSRDLGVCATSSPPPSSEKSSKEYQDSEQPVSSEAKPSNSKENECPYCHDENIVTCPVCEGRGYLGRTITCYYCRGAKKIECPLCIDDIYKLSYVRPKNPTFIETDDDDDNNASIYTKPGGANK